MRQHLSGTTCVRNHNIASLVSILFDLAGKNKSEVDIMLQAVATINTGHHTKYTDISNKIKEVKHSVVLNAEQKKDIEEQIVEELYRIFTHKAG